MLNIRAMNRQRTLDISKGRSVIKMQLANPWLGNGIQVSIDAPLDYDINKKGSEKQEGEKYLPETITEGGEPLVFCRNDPTWREGDYQNGRPDLMLTPEEVVIMYAGTKGEPGKNIGLNVHAPDFTVVPYQVLQDPIALKHKEIIRLRSIVDNKILTRLKEVA